MASKEEKRIKSVEIKKDAERYQFLREYFGQLVLTTNQDKELIVPDALKPKLRLVSMGIQPSLRKIEGSDLDRNIDEWVESFKLKNLTRLKGEKTVVSN